MNKYILMLGIAAVSIGSYCAYAGNSATMQVTATIAHDVSLSVTQDINLGTITINPLGESPDWAYSDSGIITYWEQGAITAATSPITVGTFTANIPNPSACDGTNDVCGSLRTSFVENIFGGNDGNNACQFWIKYSGSGNTFNVYPSDCFINDMSEVTTGAHEGTLTISYTAS
ncbi:MAG: hypothetical protein IJ689_02190 [Alphaproteobacteria bacterium]|nr:hypothetical protein [Alphaproteobacteria bacterium]